MKIFANLFRKKDSSAAASLVYPEGKRYYRESHKVRKNDIDPDALKIIHRLNKFGYKAFVVGGGVRDILLDKKPKDFDVATNATPNQIKKMFNNCRIIGKRFKLVHILFRGKVIEVSTFRSLPEHRKESHKKDTDYLLKKDNVFGSAKEDAARRDFTINSLYFDTRNESIIDYVGGFEDVQNRVIRVIGDPDVSFKEDPVRMLRAVKFSVLLGLDIEKKTKTAIKKNRLEILKASPARMIEEYNKIFRTWKASQIFQALAENSLLDAMIPEPFQEAKKQSDWAEKFMDDGVGKRLAIIDKMLSEREEMTPCIFYSILAYDLVSPAIEGKKGNIAHNIKQALDGFCQSMGISKRDKDKLVKIFTSQSRFLSIEDEKADQNAFFKKKDFFYDAFMVYKIIALSKQDDEALQAAFFWEISLRQRPVRDGQRNNPRHQSTSKQTGQNPRGNGRFPKSEIDSDASEDSDLVDSDETEKTNHKSDIDDIADSGEAVVVEGTSSKASGENTPGKRPPRKGGKRRPYRGKKKGKPSSP
ncbi:MAG: polynucleotide adenylyltransferase PcnB [Leptospira sp.]|nr:polynucleotide adenylyltransferase PcnB [Leptospira sp.]